MALLLTRPKIRKLPNFGLNSVITFASARLARLQSDEFAEWHDDE